MAHAMEGPMAHAKGHDSERALANARCAQVMSVG